MLNPHKVVVIKAMENDMMLHGYYIKVSIVSSNDLIKFKHVDANFSLILSKYVIRDFDVEYHNIFLHTVNKLLI